MKNPPYAWFLERLGPLPSVVETGNFLGVHFRHIAHLIDSGELEAIETVHGYPGKRRVVLNSLVEYVSKKEEVQRINHANGKFGRYKSPGLDSLEAYLGTEEAK